MLTAGIIGMGLIGGSLCKSLKNRCRFQKIVGYSRSSDSLKAALNDGVITDYTVDDFSIFCDCDFIFICTPVSMIRRYVEALIPVVKPGCIITDVGSTKSTICKSVREIMPADCQAIFIGGHPMTGSEQIGYSAATEHLFENAYYILTPNTDTDSVAVDELCRLVAKIGAIPVILDPDTHDGAVAAVSHLPHVIAAGLVNSVCSLLKPYGRETEQLAAGGFKDITRIASSSPEMWRDITVNNREMILASLEVFTKTLDGFYRQLTDEHNTDDEIYDFYSDAKVYRDSFSAPRVISASRSRELLLDVQDRPGIIATVATMLSVNHINIKNIGIINNRQDDPGALSILLDSERDAQRSYELLTAMNFSVKRK